MQESLRDRVQKEAENLSAEGDELLRLLAEAREEKHGTFNLFEFAAKYQRWYTRSLRVATMLGPDRLREFVSYYEIEPKRKTIDITTYRIQDFLSGLAPTANRYTGELPYDRQILTQVAVYNQLAILRALTSRLDSVLADVESRIATELQDAGLAAARQLLKVSVRAAGALAGVVLEDHLQRVATSRSVKIARKDPTISDLNDPLRAAEVYDQSAWRRIQFLGDIRNLCVHKKAQEPSLSQVTELLDGAAWVIANIG